MIFEVFLIVFCSTTTEKFAILHFGNDRMATESSNILKFTNSSLKLAIFFLSIEFGMISLGSLISGLGLVLGIGIGNGLFIQMG